MNVDAVMWIFCIINFFNLLERSLLRPSILRNQFCSGILLTAGGAKRNLR